MGREIRRVAPGWEHPHKPTGEYIPLGEGDFESQSIAWLEHLNWWSEPDNTQRAAWEQREGRRVFFWEYISPPQHDEYMPAWTEAEATAYQVYEVDVDGNVDGIPVSPVLPDEPALRKWLAGTGSDPKAIDRFVRSGFETPFVPPTQTDTPIRANRANHELPPIGNKRMLDRRFTH